jgi:hypothetical protein
MKQGRFIESLLSAGLCLHGVGEGVLHVTVNNIAAILPDHSACQAQVLAPGKVRHFRVPKT